MQRVVWCVWCASRGTKRQRQTAFGMCVMCVVGVCSLLSVPCVLCKLSSCSSSRLSAGLVFPKLGPHPDTDRQTDGRRLVVRERDTQTETQTYRDVRQRQRLDTMMSGGVKMNCNAGERSLPGTKGTDSSVPDPDRAGDAAPVARNSCSKVSHSSWVAICKASVHRYVLVVRHQSRRQQHGPDVSSQP